MHIPRAYRSLPRPSSQSKPSYPSSSFSRSLSYIFLNPLILFNGKQNFVAFLLASLNIKLKLYTRSRLSSQPDMLCWIAHHFATIKLFAGFHLPSKSEILWTSQVCEYDLRFWISPCFCVNRIVLGVLNVLAITFWFYDFLFS